MNIHMSQRLEFPIEYSFDPEAQLIIATVPALWGLRRGLYPIIQLRFDVNSEKLIQ
jgi:hypothetical protein